MGKGSAGNTNSGGQVRLNCDLHGAELYQQWDAAALTTLVLVIVCALIQIGSASLSISVAVASFSISGLAGRKTTMYVAASQEHCMPLGQPHKGVSHGFLAS